ncbi:MAG: Flp family type IVb pilin [Alphaproteobacteria bacterium]|nr:Flp family type IVb pilin [Alphaproteobacteria bacterium]
MTKTFARFLKDESGATAIEYGLIAALISVALIAGATLVGNELEDVFNEIGTQLKSAN